MGDVVKLPDGRLRVPAGGQDEFGNMVDGETVIGPEHPDYERWLPFMDEDQTQQPPENPDDRT